ncbi:lytic transglycosylase domain-containing protein [Roseovarius autotrophicus]|uniref:lytic transglycosylase domain-containing protein n=1 Tax=Roseovarius autotrophicus TaxID=2824121 RepID=UPI0019DB2F45|nr:lytic transglycosylase domain-containing protein [Roseovarius autotrophicus]MBE0452921.1 lytic transglycosylase domain-containing protein [Roseovarius sp.]
MLRVLGLVLMIVAPPVAVHATDLPRVAPRPLASALAAMQGGRWEVARMLAARDGAAAADLIDWHRLRAGLGEPGEILDFLGRNAHWPGLDHLRRQSEVAMTHGSFDQVLAFYDGHTPQTGTGALNLARALLARGRPGEAEAGLVLAWRTLDLTRAEHEDFMLEFAPLLAPHHEARLDMVLWRGLADVADMLPLVSDAARARAETRLRIAREGPGAVPEALRLDPGIAFETFTHHLNGSAEDAIAVLLRQSRIAGGLGEPERWASWRRALARQKMRAGEAVPAYELAALHQLAEGANYADLEWLAGYVALRYLDDPELALDHFQRLRTAVSTPISLGRAGYWLGRALEAAGDTEAAQLAYAEGAAHATSFYGLLAAEKAGVEVTARLAGEEVFADWRAADFARTDLHEIATLSLRMGNLGQARRFFLHLADSQDRPGIGQMGAMLAELDQPHLQVMLGKAAAERGIVIEAPYYPLHPMTQMDLPVPMEWSLAIARRESEFNPVVVSAAGARGLMQVMPATAREVAGRLGEDHDEGRLINDWAYNARLGSAYLAQLAARFGGNPVLIAAAYNAGPGRVTQWQQEIGDPRTRDVHGVIDWIEHIPFRETRNYVMRVTESLPAYRARLGQRAQPRPFSEELGGDGLRRATD